MILKLKKNLPPQKSYFLEDLDVGAVLVCNKSSSCKRTLVTLFVTCIMIIKLILYI